MTLKVQSEETPLWCATADSRSRATFIVFTLWVVTLALTASVLLCPYPIAWRISEVIIAGYLFFHLVPTTIQLWRSRRQARTERVSDSACPKEGQ
jgi:hypothetical protein